MRNAETFGLHKINVHERRKTLSHGAEKLQDEARRMCGSGVGRLFPPVIKWVVPSILGAMLGYNIAQEAKGTYAGYPRWAIVVFGWLMCVLIPLSFIAYGLIRPLHLLRPAEEEVGGCAGAGWGGGSGENMFTEMASLKGDSGVSSDTYREEENV